LCTIYCQQTVNFDLTCDSTCVCN